MESCRPKGVLDLGCNTGRYARLAALTGARVVAVDGDAACVDSLWHQANSENLDILPVVMDLGRPSPALGWENGEEAPFLERTEGRFDMVLALALVHHLLVRERIPMARIITHLARQTTRWAMVEWVPPEDPQFRRLAGADFGLYAGMDGQTFETAIASSFRVIRKQAVVGSLRTMYLLDLVP